MPEKELAPNSPQPAWGDGYEVETCSDVGRLAGKKEKTRPELNGAEKYDLRALESNLMAVTRGLVNDKEWMLAQVNPQAEKLVLKSHGLVLGTTFVAMINPENITEELSVHKIRTNHKFWKKKLRYHFNQRL